MCHPTISVVQVLVDALTFNDALSMSMSAPLACASLATAPAASKSIRTLTDDGRWLQLDTHPPMSAPRSGPRSISAPGVFRPRYERTERPRTLTEQATRCTSPSFRFPSPEMQCTLPPVVPAHYLSSLLHLGSRSTSTVPLDQTPLTRGGVLSPSAAFAYAGPSSHPFAVDFYGAPETRMTPSPVSLVDSTQQSACLARR